MWVSHRVLVALSGGVDSAVAAARLLDAGHEVVAATLRLTDRTDDDAPRVAAWLGIEHHWLDRRQRFAERVVEPFVAAYLAGRTPSPCVWCNPEVKIHAMMELADRLGAARIATGHYARMTRDDRGVPRLRCGIDRRKDQSYFLFRLEPAARERLCFPVGESTKAEVRAEATARGVPTAAKEESQQLCFVGPAGYATFVEQWAGAPGRAGPLEDAAGREIGRHQGIHRFTVGQRRGLGVALGEPAFVTAIDSERAAVRLGTAADAVSSTALIGATVWHEPLRWPVQAWVKVRSQQRAIAAEVRPAADDPSGQQCLVAFAEPVRAVAPGQAAVLYRQDWVLGGGTLLAADRGGEGRP